MRNGGGTAMDSAKRLEQRNGEGDRSVKDRRKEMLLMREREAEGAHLSQVLHKNGVRTEIV